MENEIMNYENEAMECEVVETDGTSGMSTGAAIAIGAGLAFAATAVVKLVKYGWAKIKAHRAVNQPEDGECIEPTDEELEEVTGK